MGKTQIALAVFLCLLIPLQSTVAASTTVAKTASGFMKGNLNLPEEDLRRIQKEKIRKFLIALGIVCAIGLLAVFALMVYVLSIVVGFGA